MKRIVILIVFAGLLYGCSIGFLKDNVPGLDPESHPVVAYKEIKP